MRVHSPFYERLLRWLGMGPVSPHDLGRRGERRALRFYRLRGFRMLERNLTTGDGEIDLVVRRGRLVVFAEVKTRRTRGKGEPHEAVGTGKQRQLIRLAQRFLEERRLEKVDVRFDVVSLFWNGRRFELQHFPDAFRPQATPGRPWKWE